MISTLALGTLLFLTTGDPATCPLHEQHMKAAAEAAEHVKANGDMAHGAEVDARHDTFGMAHDISHHNFRLFADGGAIELRANDPQDTATIATIRGHLRDIASQFSRDDFGTPAFVHGYPPDGVAAMKRLSKEIVYRYEEVSSGGRIRVTTRDAAALAAVHDFMKFQVTEHRTADSGKVEPDK